MATQQNRTDPAFDGKTVISVDAMGGDRGAAAVIAGLSRSAKKNPDISFILHGDEAELKALLRRRPLLSERTVIRHAATNISMDEKPSKALRRGKGSSMWSALEAVASGDATVAVSCGNTGALMAMSMLQLRKLPNVGRPAIAVLWPSRNPAGYNILLDAGADIRADAADLVQYAVMGASYARNGLKLVRPRVGLLNVGTELHKGRTQLREAAEIITQIAPDGDFEFVGFVEGSDLPTAKVDVVVTDGFSGNVALKTAEGTASLIRGLLREAFAHTPLSRIGALFALTSLRRLHKRIDPRHVNGGVFLGLNGTVIKSHGGADATGISAAIKLAFVLAHNGFSEKLARRVASGLPRGEDSRQNKGSEAGLG
ncbi:MAG: phosphate acyltransferase PlsX [Paracoccaceae bacterium]